MTKLTVRRAKVGEVRDWVEALGVLTCDNMTPTEAAMKTLAYVPMLQDDFPPEAFTQESLSHVARQCKYFPAYAEIYNHLREWWRARRPMPVALPAPVPERRPEPTEEEKAHVTAIVQQLTAELRVTAINREVGNNDLAQQEEPRRPRAYYLTPAQLDIINPLPNGLKRVQR